MDTIKEQEIKNIVLDVLNRSCISINMAGLDIDNAAIVIAAILSTMEDYKWEQKKQKTTAELVDKLDKMREVNDLKNEMKKISWFAFSERRKLRFKIIEAESRLYYGY